MTKFFLILLMHFLATAQCILLTRVSVVGPLEITAYATVRFNGTLWQEVNFIDRNDTQPY